MSILKDVLSILGLIGFPSLFGIAVYIKGVIKKYAKKQRATELGLQAILRCQMITEYNKWFVNQHYAPIWAKQNFENLWVQYEAFGENGVMNGIHDDFMSLPTEPPVSE